jgi:hypothetical protein
VAGRCSVDSRVEEVAEEVAEEEEMGVGYPKTEGDTEGEASLTNRQIGEDTEEVNLMHRQVGEHPAGEEARAGWCSLQEAYYLEGGYHQVEYPEEEMREEWCPLQGAHHLEGGYHQVEYPQEEMREEWCSLQGAHHLEGCYHPVVCHSWDRFSDVPVAPRCRASAPGLR